MSRAAGFWRLRNCALFAFYGLRSNWILHLDSTLSPYKLAALTLQVGAVFLLPAPAASSFKLLSRFGIVIKPNRLVLRPDPKPLCGRLRRANQCVGHEPRVLKTILTASAAACEQREELFLPTTSINAPTSPLAYESRSNSPRLQFAYPRWPRMGPSPVFMPVISQPSQFTATAACSPQTSRRTACQAH